MRKGTGISPCLFTEVGIISMYLNISFAYKVIIFQRSKVPSLPDHPQERMTLKQCWFESNWGVLAVGHWYTNCQYAGEVRHWKNPSLRFSYLRENCYEDKSDHKARTDEAQGWSCCSTLTEDLSLTTRLYGKSRLYCHDMCIRRPVLNAGCDI